MVAPRVYIKRTSAVDSPPQGLAPGEFGLEMSNPLRLWVGVPTAVDAAGRKLVSSTAIISDEPPLFPTHGQLWWESDHGTLWIYYQDTDSGQWVQAAGGGIASDDDDGEGIPVDAYNKEESDQRYVNIPGDTMTGNLTIKTAGNPTLALNKTTAGGASDIVGQYNGASRWLMRLGSFQAEAGGNSGSDFELDRYTDAGVLAAALHISRANATATFAGNLNAYGTANIGGAIELGSTTVPNNPYIDFHSSGVGGDFDGRIICTGGSGAGNGGLAYTGASHAFSGYMYANGITNTGNIANSGSISAGDIYASRGANNGYVFLGSNGSHYVGFDGNQYVLPNGPTVTYGQTNHGSQTNNGQLVNNGQMTNNGEMVVAGSIQSFYYTSVGNRINIASDSSYRMWVDNPSNNRYFHFQWDAGFFFMFSPSTGGMHYNVGNVVTTLWRWDNAMEQHGEAYKPGGGFWAALSDGRVKNVLGDYTSGLAEIKQLSPVRYTYKGNSVSYKASEDELAKFSTGGIHPDSPHFIVATAGTEYVGLIAQQAETSMPELVKQEEAYIDGEKVTDMRVLDSTAIVFALINAVKELSAEVDALKARLPAAGRR